MSHEPTLADAADAIEEVYYRFQCFTQTHSDLVNRAHHLVELQNAVSDLATFHPSYDVNSGTMGYEREDAELEPPQTELEKLKTEQELLIRMIKSQKDPAALAFGAGVPLGPVEARLETVNQRIAGLEG